MKKLATIVSVLSILTFGLFAPLALAQNPVDDVDCSGAAASSPVCEDLQSGVNPLFGEDGVLTKAANIFAIVTGIISVFMMSLGGLRYIMSSGDTSKLNSAKNTIMYAAIGLGVAASAGIIARFILSSVASGS